MFAKIFVLVCALSAVLAYPYEQDLADGAYVALQDADQYANYGQVEQAPHLQRLKRQLNVQGGGSPGQGFDVSANARVPVWQSDNGRHSFDATAGYSQHLGGPYGNSRPNLSGGGVYTFRF